MYHLTCLQVYYNAQAQAVPPLTWQGIGNPCAGINDATPAQPKIGLGSQFGDGDTGGGNPYGTVSLDEIRIWDHLRLTEEEIQKVYNNDL